MQQKENLISFLLNDSERLREMIFPLIETKNFLIENEPDVFHEEIIKQFNERMNNLLIEEFCKHFTITPEEAMILLEDVSLEDYFKC